MVESSAQAETLKLYVPQQVVAGLAADASIAEQREVEVTVLFSDIRGFSTLVGAARRRAISPRWSGGTCRRWPR